MNLINNEKDTRKIEELVATNRLLTDLTEAGSWTINFCAGRICGFCTMG